MRKLFRASRTKVCVVPKPNPEGRCITLAAPDDFPGLGLRAELFACHNCDAPKTVATPIGVAHFTACHAFEGAAAKKREQDESRLINKHACSLAKRNAAPLMVAPVWVSDNDRVASDCPS